MISKGNVNKAGHNNANTCGLSVRTKVQYISLDG